jgi:hypothetical protein
LVVASFVVSSGLILATVLVARRVARLGPGTFEEVVVMEVMEAVSRRNTTVGFALDEAASDDVFEDEGSILQNSISAENSSDEFSSSNFGQTFTQLHI